MATNMFTANFPQITALRGLHMVVNNAWKERPRVGRQLFRVYESRQYREHSQTIGGVGNMAVKLEGASIDYDSLTEGFTGTFTHVDYAKGLRASRNMMRDELYGVVDDQAVELGLSAHSSEETLLANHFNNGFDSTAATGPDGLELFSLLHLDEAGGTYANELSSAADLSATSIEQALIDFRAQTDGSGVKKIQVKPRFLVVPPALQWTAWKLTGSTHDPESDKNAINPLNDMGLQVVVWDFLTDTDAWFILGDQRDIGLVLYTREEFWTEHIYDFDSKDYKISGMFSQSSGWWHPRGVFGSPGI